MDLLIRSQEAAVKVSLGCSSHLGSLSSKPMKAVVRIQFFVAVWLGSPFLASWYSLLGSSPHDSCFLPAVFQRMSFKETSKSLSPMFCRVSHHYSCLFLPSSINPPGVCSCGCWVQLTMCRGKGLCWPSKPNAGFLTSQSAPLTPNLALGRHFRNYQRTIPNYVLLLFLSLAVTQNSLILSLKLGRNQV
jgi:hypothetical protein